MSFVKQYWFRQSGEDLWHLDRDYFCNHFWKADLCGQGPGLDKEVKGELVQLLNNLGEGEKRLRKKGIDKNIAYLIYITGRIHQELIVPDNSVVISMCYLCCFRTRFTEGIMRIS